MSLSDLSDTDDESDRLRLYSFGCEGGRIQNFIFIVLFVFCNWYEFLLQAPTSTIDMNMNRSTGALHRASCVVRRASCTVRSKLADLVHIIILFGSA